MHLCVCYRALYLYTLLGLMLTPVHCQRSQLWQRRAFRVVRQSPYYIHPGEKSEQVVLQLQYKTPLLQKLCLQTNSLKSFVEFSELLKML